MPHGPDRVDDLHGNTGTGPDIELGRYLVEDHVRDGRQRDGHRNLDANPRIGPLRPLLCALWDERDEGELSGPIGLDLALPGHAHAAPRA